MRKARDKNREPGFFCLLMNLLCEDVRPASTSLGTAGAARSFLCSRPRLSCYSGLKSQCRPVLELIATCDYFS